VTTVPPRPPIPPKRGKRSNVKTYTLWSWIKGYAAWLLVLPLYLGLWAFATLCPRLPKWLTRKLLLAHKNYTRDHGVDFRIPPDAAQAPYMLRWWRIARNAYFNIYYHFVLRSDDDRALHDHPWWNFSIVLDGGYYEHTIEAGGVEKCVWYGPGSVRFRRAGTFAHRLELARQHATGKPWTPDGMEMPVRTIFITGPVLRRWGFHHPDQWVDAYEWDDFMAARGIDGMKMGGGSDGAVSPRNKI